MYSYVIEVADSESDIGLLKQSFSFGYIGIYSNKSNIHFAISSNKINKYLKLNQFLHYYSKKQ